MKIYQRKVGAVLAFILCTCLLVTACDERTVDTVAYPSGGASVPGIGDGETETGAFSSEVATGTGITTEYSKFDQDATDTGADTTVLFADGTATVTGNGAVFADNTLTVNAAGTYLLSGTLDGQIYVEAGDNDKVHLIFAGLNVTSGDRSCVYVKNADKVSVTLADGTVNTVTDTGDPETAYGSATRGAAAIYAKCALTVNGTGTLNIEASFKHGIMTKKALKILGGVLNITAYDCGLKGENSLSVADGEITVSCGSSALRSDETKDEDKGYIFIEGGSITVTASKHVAKASRCLLITGGTIVGTATATAFQCEAEDENDEVIDGIGYLCISGGGITLTSTESNGISCAEDIAVTGGEITVTSYGDGIQAGGSLLITDGTVTVTTGGGSAVSVSGSSFRTFPGGTTSVSEESQKGLKAANDLTVSGGSLTLDCRDDAVHSNVSVTVAGGTLTISTGDDGIHADSVLTVTGGTICVTKSYEGLEAETIRIEGGYTTVVASDDGVNAANGTGSSMGGGFGGGGRPGMGGMGGGFPGGSAASASSCSITISGGYLEVTVPSGDTDGIDSNGNLTVTGGVVFVKGGGSGNVCGSVDVDGSITVTGGMVLAVGGICEVPSTASTANTVYFSRKTFAAGNYRIEDANGSTIAEFDLPTSYSAAWFSSPLFETGASYTVYKDGNRFTSWKQTSRTQSAT